MSTFRFTYCLSTKIILHILYSCEIKNGYGSAGMMKFDVMINLIVHLAHALVFPENYWIALRITGFNQTLRLRECGSRNVSRKFDLGAPPLY